MYCSPKCRGEHKIKKNNGENSDVITIKEGSVTITYKKGDGAEVIQHLLDKLKNDIQS